MMQTTTAYVIIMLMAYARAVVRAMERAGRQQEPTGLEEDTDRASITVVEEDRVQQSEEDRHAVMARGATTAEVPPSLMPIMTVYAITSQRPPKNNSYPSIIKKRARQLSFFIM